MKNVDSLPKSYRSIIDHLGKAYSTRSLRPPTIIKGPRGSGKSWILYMLFKRLSENSKSTNIIPVKVPMQLNALNLISIIRKEIEKAQSTFIAEMAGKEPPASNKLKYVLLIENIDELFNLRPEGEKNVSARIKTHSPSFFASELRRFLIENSNKITLFATTGIEIRFTEDPDQAFFEFFNIIELTPFSELESQHYIFTSLERSKIIQNRFKKLIDIFHTLNEYSLTELTDGNISLLNLFIDTVSSMNPQKGTGEKHIDVISDFFNGYFYRIAPHMQIIINQLSYNERILVDRIALAPTPFRLKDISFKKADTSLQNLNFSLYMKNLIKKDLVVTLNDGLVYMLSSQALKAWIRFHKRLNNRYIINPSSSTLS